MKNLPLLFIISLAFMGINNPLQAQETAVNAVNNSASTKIEVVIGVILIIFILVLLYLLRLENKLKKLEKK
jgi:uncharacterized membrane protein YidH (DUF202 family)